MKSRDPFDVKLTAEDKKSLGLWLQKELQAALDAKTAQDGEVDYWHTIYEQGRTRLGRNLPWPDAADLTSYLGTEKVDALHARLMRTIWSEPVYQVEGWGKSAQNAPFVEEFHQWKVEEERLQTVLDRLALISLIEPRGLLEVYEGQERRVTRKTIKAKLQLDELTGGPVFGADGKPLLQQNGDEYVEAVAEEPAAEMVIDTDEPIRKGPQYRILPYRDSVILPGYARDRDEVWGYGKRFWRRFPELQQNKAYDQDAVETLTNTAEREADAALQRSNQSIAAQEGPTAQKELWELQVLMDPKAILKGKPEGERFYLVTFHLGQGIILRIQHDDLGQRYLPVILFPRSDRCTEGFSLIGHKLVTTIEEHTAYRNMLADRASMKASQPIKRLENALWHPDEQPFGPKAVIDVRDMREVEQLIIEDVPQSLVQREQNMERTAERLAGVSDVASGQTSKEDRTLGEVQMATEQSFVRMDLIVRRFQEFMEDLGQVRHKIWQRTLASQPDGIDVPQSVSAGLDSKGVELPNGKLTALLLEGTFRFKPRGSVETADPNRLRSDFVQMVGMLPKLLQAFPMLAQQFMSPQAARAMAEQFVRTFRIPNRQAFVGPPGQMMAAPPMVPGMGAAGQMFPGPGAGAMGAPPSFGQPLGQAQAGPPPGTNLLQPQASTSAMVM